MTRAELHAHMDGIVRHIIGHTLGTVVVNPVLEYVDVNGVVQRIDIDELAEKIDINAILEKTDINRLLDRVDFNRQLQRIDYDSILEKIDINEVVQRSDVGAIIAQSTSGIFTPVLDAIRTKIVVMDLFCIRMSRFKVKGQKKILPPRPGVEPISEPEFFPEKEANKAIVMQGRYAGFFSKAVAIFLDNLFVTVMFACFNIFMKLCWVVFLGSSTDEAEEKLSRENIEIFIVYAIFWFLYFYLTVLPTGRTMGMTLVGIELRNSNGSEFASRQAAMRTLLLPISLTVMPFLGLVGFFRRDGRMLHDLVAGTGLIYAWDAVMAKARRKAAVRLERMEFATSETELRDSQVQRDSLRSDESFYNAVSDAASDKKDS